MNNLMRLGTKRFVIILVLASVLTLVANEAFYRLQKDSYDRQPRQIELVIPPGTAERVEAGEPAPGIPEEMAFVVGDILIVRNRDSKDHQLGPLWIPSGTSASLNLDRPMQYAYSCSFQTTSYMGLDVRMPTTMSTRFQGLMLAAPATVVFLFLYSLLLFPLQPASGKEKAAGPFSQPISQPRESSHEG